jgi:hypothetical protein
MIKKSLVYIIFIIYPLVIYFKASSTVSIPIDQAVSSPEPIGTKATGIDTVEEALKYITKG